MRILMTELEREYERDSKCVTLTARSSATSTPFAFSNCTTESMILESLSDVEQQGDPLRGGVFS